MNEVKDGAKVLNKTPLSRLQQSSRRSRQAFKSPLRQVTSDPPLLPHMTDEKQSLLEEIKTLQEKEQSISEKIEELNNEGLKEEELAIHIEKLHEYNEIKDIGQALLGKIAMQQGITTRQLYERFDLNLED